MKKRIAGFLVAMVAALSVASPALASEGTAASGGPVKLNDSELDQVTAGAGALLDLNLFANVMLKDITVMVNLSNVPINAGVVLQANALGQALQSATVVAYQQVTQVQTMP
jgi:hypothetical protein